MFSCGICGNFKNNYFKEHLQRTSSIDLNGPYRSFIASVSIWMFRTVFFTGARMRLPLCEPSEHPTYMCTLLKIWSIEWIFSGFTDKLEGSWKIDTLGGSPKKGAWKVCRFKGRLGEKYGLVFLRGIDTPRHAMVKEKKLRK